MNANNSTGIGGNTTPINQYTNYYESKQFTSVEEITLAEDIIFADFTDIFDAKFFYRIVTPEVDDIEEEPEERDNGGVTTCNYINLDIPSNILWSMVKPTIQIIAVDKDTGVLRIPTEEDLEDKEVEKISFTTLPGELHTGVYKIVKGTVFLVEMLSGKMKTDFGRIVGVSMLQKVDDGGIAIEVDEEVPERSMNIRVSTKRNKVLGNTNATKYNQKKNSYKAKQANRL